MAITPRKMLCPAINKSWKFPHPMAAEFYVVHNTANDASANNEITYMNRTKAQGGVQVSYHYAIDDKEVVQGLEENVNGWHAGDGAEGAGNRKGIGIEICYSKSGGDRFIAAERLAAEFIAQELKKKGWGLDRVKKHQDFDTYKKYCPHRTLDMGWQRFLDMINSYLNPVQPNPTPLKVGDIINFLGGKHYTSANGDKGKEVNAGPAKITNYVEGAKHPYHVIHTDKSSTVYGWVNADRIEKGGVVRTPEVGDIVTFAGGKHYVSSNGYIGYNAKGGAAKVTNYVKNAKHPYHLVRVAGGTSTVYGWVNADTIK
jgi:N-acetylmuramoyl-L-alanine amidase CwlA